MTEKVFDICERTLLFGVRIVKCCSVLNQKGGESRELARQLIRSGTSIGANIEEAQAAQSTADFISKMEIALKETRETRYWIRLIIAAEIVPESQLISLLNEVNELLKIVASIILKKKQNKENKF